MLCSASFSKAIVCAVLLATSVVAAPASSPSSTVSAPSVSQTVTPASDDPNDILWGPDIDTVPQAIRGSLGATVLGPQDVGIVKENADFLAPPTTDSGSVYVDYYYYFF